MSLKTFHLFFMTVCILFALGFGTWALGEYRRVDGWPNLVMTIGSFICAAAMFAYGRWFLRKMEGIS